MGKRIRLLCLVITAACTDDPKGPEKPATLAKVQGDLAPLVLSVFDRASDDVWLVGGQPGDFGGLLAHFDGKKITQVEAPLGPTLWWVFAVDGDVFAGGEGGRILVRKAGVWREEPTGLSADKVLWGIWGSSKTDLWAVGGSKTFDGSQAVVLRSFGDGNWRRIEDPVVPLGNFFKVWGSGPNDVHLVGYGGNVLHFDGQSLRAVEVPEPALLIGVHTNGILAVAVGQVPGVIFRFEDGRWVDDGTPEDLPGMNGVWVRQDGTALASSVYGQIFERNEEGIWEAWPEDRIEGLDGEGLHAVSARDRVWAVGGDLVRGRYGVIATTFRPLPELALMIRPQPDAGVDAGSDAGPSPEDAGHDGGLPDLARFDSGPDGSSDLGFDAGVDGGSDAGSDLDAGFPDQGFDAGFPDVGFDAGFPDQGFDAGFPDVGFDAGSPDMGFDAGPPDVGFAGRGEECAVIPCQSGLQCHAVIAAGFRRTCTERCTIPADCIGYGPNPCCMIPGPQLIEPYCVPSVILPGEVCP